MIPTIGAKISAKVAGSGVATTTEAPASVKFAMRSVDIRPGAQVNVNVFVAAASANVVLNIFCPSLNPYRNASGGWGRINQQS